MALTWSGEVLWRIGVPQSSKRTGSGAGADGGPTALEYVRATGPATGASGGGALSITSDTAAKVYGWIPCGHDAGNSTETFRHTVFALSEGAAAISAGSSGTFSTSTMKIVSSKLSTGAWTVVSTDDMSGEIIYGLRVIR